MVSGHLDTVGDASLSGTWKAYAQVHDDIRRLDDTGRWDAAVTKATGGGDNSANATFTAFDAAASGFVNQQVDQTATGVRGPQTALWISAVLAVLAGVAAGALGRAGVGARLREYR
jgi:hypothetical protein